jgi:ubiquitin carboxyl-terminal hydrolase 1
MLATHQRLQQEANKLSEALSTDSNASISKKKKAKDARRMEVRLRTALEQGRIEDDVKGVKMEKVFSKASTKQAMVARVCICLLILHDLSG